MRYHLFHEIPDLPIDAFKHIGDRKIRPQGGGGGIPVVSDVVNAISDAGQGVVNTINSAATTVVDQVVTPVVKAVENTANAVVQDPLGSAAKIATAVYAPAYLPAVVAADAVAKGAPIDKALEQAATAYVAQNVGSSVGNYVNNAVDNTAAANQYGTNVGSQQTNMLAQQDSGLGTPADTTGNIAGTVAGGTAAGVIRGQDPLTALKNSGITAGTVAVTDQIPGFSELSPGAQKAVNAVVSTALQGGNPSQALVNSAINLGISEARNQVNAPTTTVPSGTQVASTDGGLPTVQMSGSPIYAESSTANSVTAPFGFDLMPASLSDNKPAGAYYDMYQNAWFMPNQDTQNLQQQLQNQTPNVPLTTQEAPPVTLMDQTPTTGGLPVAPANVVAGSSTVAPSTLDTVAKTNQTALNTAIQSNNPDLVSAVVNNNAPVIAALAGGDVATATNLVGSTSNVPAAPVVNQNQTAVTDTKPPVDLTPVGPLAQTENAPTGISGTTQQTTGPLTNLTSAPVQTSSSSSSSVLPTAAAAAATAAAAAGANQMGTSGTSGVQLDYTPHFVKGTPINLVGEPKFETSYISPQQMQVQAPSPYTLGMQGFAEGSSVSMQPQFAHGRPQFLQGLMTPMMRPQVGHMQFKRYSEGHSVEDEHVPEFYSEGGLKSIDHTYVTGDGDGTSDSIPAMLANGEFVIPADVVASLGNGSNESGASVLDQFMKVIREHKRDAHPDHLPPDSKGPLAYLQEAQKKVK